MQEHSTAWRTTPPHQKHCLSSTAQHPPHTHLPHTTNFNHSPAISSRGCDAAVQRSKSKRRKTHALERQARACTRRARAHTHTYTHTPLHEGTRPHLDQPPQAVLARGPPGFYWRWPGLRAVHTLPAPAGSAHSAWAHNHWRTCRGGCCYFHAARRWPLCMCEYVYVCMCWCGGDVFLWRACALLGACEHACHWMWGENPRGTLGWELRGVRPMCVLRGGRACVVQEDMSRGKE